MSDNRETCNWNMDLEIAGVKFRISGLPDEARDVLGNRYDAFASPDHDMLWEVEWGFKGNPDGPWEMSFEETPAGWRFGRGDMVAEWNPDTRRGTLKVAASEFTFDSWLRVWISSLLLEDNGGLFHACGAVRDGKGYIFTGKSGSGKSTTARACGPDELLSDELVALRASGGGFRIFGTPFMGELNIGGRNLSGQIDRVLVLDRRIPPGTQRMNEPEALAELWGTLMCFSRSYAFAGYAMKLCENIAREMPCERFSFNMAEGPWKVLNE